MAVLSSYALDSQNATTVMALPRTLSTSVFWRPAMSAMNPMAMRLTVFTALLTDRSAAPLRAGKISDVGQTGVRRWLTRQRYSPASC